MTEAILVRTLRLADLEALASLEERAQRRAWSPSALAEELVHNDGHVLGLETSTGVLAGFVIARRMLDELWILNLAVDPAARRHGLGLRLVVEVQGLARRLASTIWLEVRAGNGAARALYGRAGFAERAARRGYYPSEAAGGAPEDAILMSMAVAVDPDARVSTGA